MKYMDRQEVLDKGFIELLDIMGTDETVVIAARASNLEGLKGPEKDKKLVNYLMKHRHMTPFEIPQILVRVKCPIFVARQWFRHRAFHYNELSRRYSSEDIEFYIPDEIRNQAESNMQSSYGNHDRERVWIHNIESASMELMRYYDKMIEDGVANEQARVVLPQNLYTVFICLMDLRNCLHFINLRADKHAQKEIQVYAYQLLEWVKEYFPWVYEAYKRENSS